MKIIDVGDINLSLFDHTDIDEISDDFQAVIETKILMASERPCEILLIQDFYNEKAEYKRDAFYQSKDEGCKEIPLMR